MRFVTIGFCFLFALIAEAGFCQQQGTNSAIPKPPGATNNFAIHLQEGFYEGYEVIIKVDGREVYKGIPRTMPMLGIATAVSVNTASSHPMVNFTMPSKHIDWSRQIDLNAGPFLGISVEINGTVLLRQSAQEPGYDQRH
jgi:hypothetical protein